MYGQGVTPSTLSVFPSLDCRTLSYENDADKQNGDESNSLYRSRNLAGAPHILDLTPVHNYPTPKQRANTPEVCGWRQGRRMKTGHSARVQTGSTNTSREGHASERISTCSLEEQHTAEIQLQGGMFNFCTWGSGKIDSTKWRTPSRLGARAGGLTYHKPRRAHSLRWPLTNPRPGPSTRGGDSSRWLCRAGTGQDGIRRSGLGALAGV